MARKYYYLVASLPPLALGEPLPFTPEEWARGCATMMEPEDFEELRRALDGRIHEGTSAFARAYTQLETQLRNAVAVERAKRRGVEPRRYLREHAGFSVGVEEAVEDAYEQKDPLAREEALDRCRWQMAEELAREDAFGLSALLAFAVKLRLAQRWARLDKRTGAQALQERVEAGLVGLGLRAGGEAGAGTTP